MPATNERGGGHGGSTVVNVSVTGEGSVWTENQLARPIAPKIHTELVRHGQRNGTIFGRRI